MRDLIGVLDAWLPAWGRVALATVTSTWGATPRPAGSHMVISPRGEFAGSVSGGCVEGAVVEAGLAVLEDGAPKLLEFGVADELAWDVGLACGGEISVFVSVLQPGPVYEALRQDLSAGAEATLCTAIAGPHTGEWLLLRANGDAVGDLAPLHGALREAVRQAGGEPEVIEAGESRVFVQRYPPPLRLVIIGAVHTAVPLVSLARAAGYHVTVVDARSAFATRDRFPDADELLVEWPDDALARLEPDANTAVVVLTHDPKFDEPALSAALRSEAGYIGAIGSRATSEGRALRLRALGFTTEQIERIHSPIGLNLGAVTPAEIALSILAEIVAERHGRPGGSLRAAAQAVSGP
jgi:xanthine dehydrogenase accessory factor